ncbi:acyltransferase family protein [Actinomadura sp. 21ATH]|uniref:acyltransferase family protein n=1 Tax=Actinomadura sp. 21ATH TaxID=1735444 RepID=UPI0035C2694B
MSTPASNGRWGTTRRVAPAARPAAPRGLPAVSGHQDALDGIRAIAALIVLVYHVAGSSGALHRGGYGWLYNGGQIGVPIFFALSGLLLYRPWAAAVLDPDRPRPSTRTYLRRRAFRILPAYWAAVVCFMVTAGLAHVTDAVSWVSLLTLTHTYIPDPWWGSTLGPAHLGQIWSLTVEAAWYLTLPATAAVLAWYARRSPAGDVGARARRLLRALAVYAALSFAYTAAMFVPEPKPMMGLWLPRFFAWFAIGMALAVVTVWARLEPAGPVPRLCRTVAGSWRACWAAAALLYVIGSTPATGPLDLVTLDVVWTSMLEVLVNGLCAAALVAPVALASERDTAIGAVLGNPVMRFLGRISYSVFLWQMLIVVGWYEWTGRTFRGDVMTDLPLLLAATIAAATVSYYLVERPVQRLSRPRRDRDRRPPAPAPAPAQEEPRKREREREPRPAEPAAPAPSSSARSTLPDLPAGSGGDPTAERPPGRG